MKIHSEVPQDDSKALKEYGVHSKTRLLVLRTAKAAASSKLASQEDRALRLTRLRDAAAALASRGDGRFPTNYQKRSLMLAQNLLWVC